MDDFIDGYARFAIIIACSGLALLFIKNSLCVLHDTNNDDEYQKGYLSGYNEAQRTSTYNEARADTYRELLDRVMQPQTHNRINIDKEAFMRP